MTRNQGQGASTPRKERGLAMVLKQRLRISKACARFPYWHIDLNAGCGTNYLAGCEGSPLVFLDEAIEQGRNFNALFCDHDPKAVDELRQATAFQLEATDSCSLRVCCSDNADALRDFSQWITGEDKRPDMAIGTCLCDPNGRHGIPLETLAWFGKRHPRIDIALHLNLSLFARVRGCKGNSKTPGFDHWPDPQDVLGLRPLREYWLVRNPPHRPQGKGESFATFLGSNTEAGMTPFEDFFRLDSDKGASIVNTLRRVNPDQGDLLEGLL